MKGGLLTGAAERDRAEKGWRAVNRGGFGFGFAWIEDSFSEWDCPLPFYLLTSANDGWHKLITSELAGGVAIFERLLPAC